MKLSKESYYDRKEKKRQFRHERSKGWHRWFALFPVRLESGDRVCVEMIERKGVWEPYRYVPGTGGGVGGYFNWTYRAIK